MYFLQHYVPNIERSELVNTAVSDIPRGTLRLSQTYHLSECFCDRALFEYVSFIRSPQETKAFVLIFGVISVVEYIANERLI